MDGDVQAVGNVIRIRIDEMQDIRALLFGGQLKEVVEFALFLLGDMGDLVKGQRAGDLIAGNQPGAGISPSLAHAVPDTVRPLAAGNRAFRQHQVFLMRGGSVDEEVDFDGASAQKGVLAVLVKQGLPPEALQGPVAVVDVVFPAVLAQDGGEGIVPVPQLRGSGGGIAVLAGDTDAVLRHGGDGAETGQQAVNIQGGVLSGDSRLHTRQLLVGQGGNLGIGRLRS